MSLLKTFIWSVASRITAAVWTYFTAL